MRTKAATTRWLMAASIVLAGVVTSVAATPVGAAQRLKLPPTSGGCQVATPAPGQAVSVPLAVNRSKGQVIALVSLCVDGKGPFPLVLDTGSTESSLDSQVVKTLHLPGAGKKATVAGASCTAKEQPVKVSGWSLGTVPLAGQTVETSAIPDFGLHKAPAGLLGADVLSRFGAVRIDYQHSRLILPGPEGPVVTGKQVVTPNGATPTPPDLLVGYPAPTTIPMGVVHVADQVLAVVPVTFAGPMKFAFLLDTGSSGSTVSTGAAANLKLTTLGKRAPVTGVACTTSAARVKSGTWALSGTPLPAQTLVAIKLPGTTGIAGTIGSDVLSRFDSVVIDFAGGRLLV